jgi:hypothetical protein
MIKPLPYDCGLSLPLDDRLACERFRRVRGDIQRRRLDLGDAQELCATMRTVGGHACAVVFGWKPYGRKRVNQLCQHLADDPEVARMTRENLQACGVDQAMMLCLALAQAGWKPTGRVGWPGIIRVALLDLKSRGFSAKEVAARFGLPLALVKRGMLPVESQLHWF